MTATPNRPGSRLHPVPSVGASSTPASLASTFLPNDNGQAGDSVAAVRWGLRTFWWLILICVVAVGVLLPLQQLGSTPKFTSESLVVASDMTADVKVLPRYGEAVFDNGQVASVIIEQFGDAGDIEDVIPLRASVVTEQDSVVFRVQGHARDAQTSADIANAAAEVFTSELNKVGSGIGTFAVQSSAIPPLERDEPLRAAPYSVSVGLLAGLVAGLGLLTLVLVIRRPVVDAAAATRTTDLPVFGTVTLPRAPRSSSVSLDDVGGLPPLCRQVIDWSPGVLVLTGPPDVAVERHHLAVSLSVAFDQVRHDSFAPASAGRPGETDADASVGLEGFGADIGAITVIDGSDAIDLIAPGPRSFVLLVVPFGIGTSVLRRLAAELRGVPTAIVLVRTRRWRRRRSGAARSVRHPDSADEPHRSVPPAPPAPPAPRRPVGSAERKATGIAKNAASISAGNGVSRDVSREVLSWVAAEAPDWFPDVAAGGSSLSITRTLQRPRCRLYEVEVRGRDIVETLVVKQRVLDASSRRRDAFAETRPRLAPSLTHDDELAARTELVGLQAMYDSLRDRPSRRFAGVRPFGLNRELAAIAMERVQAPTLRSLWTESAGVIDPLILPWHNAGAWLKRYHDVMATDELPVQRGSRSEVVALFQSFATFLGARVGNKAFLDNFADQASQAAEMYLADQLPIFAAHGDFVAQNIFVLADSSVAVIDPFPRWQASPLEDLGRLMVGARRFEPVSRRPDHGSDHRRPRPSERAVLSGYFGARVPVGPMRVFLALCTLDRWADTVSKEPPGLVRRAVRSSQVASAGKYYLRELHSQLPLMSPAGQLGSETWV